MTDPTPGRPSRSGPLRSARRVGAVLVLVAVFAGVAAAATTTATVTASPALAQASGPTDCSGRLEVLLLMDESASLATTDPDDQRVAAAEVLVDSLSASAEASNGTVNLTIAGFGTAAGDIGRVTLPADRGSAIGVVRGFADRNTDANTDYVLALRYAANHFANFPDVPVACKRLVWFTDGAYSIDDPSAPGIISYTRATTKGVIESQLEGQLCGPLPGDAVTTVPISQQIQAAGFVVQLLDFRVEGVETSTDRAERAATTPVIDRLLASPPGDPCRVPGGRVLASQAADLAAEFFTQGQIAAGRQPLDCAVLDGGYPAAIVQSLTVRNSAPDEQVSVALDGKEVASGAGFATYSPADGPPRGGRLSVSTAGGSPSGCYAALSATAALVDDGSIFADATSSLLRLTVYAGGPEGDASPQGPEAVALTATVERCPGPGGVGRDHPDLGGHRDRARRRSARPDRRRHRPGVGR